MSSKRKKENRENKENNVAEKKTFCPLDYEYITVTPTVDGLNNFHTHTTYDFEIGSLQDWLEIKLTEMKDLFRNLKIEDSKLARGALQAYEKALRSAFKKEVFEFASPPKKDSKLAQRAKRYTEEHPFHSDEEEDDCVQ